MTADMELPKKTEKRSEVLVLLGPSLNMLGVREPEKYGSKSCAELVDFCVKTGLKLGLDVTVKQSNWEGELVTWIQDAKLRWDISGTVLDASALTHTSIALLDALLAVKIPCVEVHLPEPLGREDFRRVSCISQACFARCAWKGFKSFKEALELLAKKLES